MEIDDGSSNGDLEDFVYASEGEEDAIPGKGLTGHGRMRNTPRSSTGANGDLSEEESDDSQDYEEDDEDDDDDDEEGYNSSEIDAMEGSSSPSSSIHPPSRPTSSLSLTNTKSKSIPKSSQPSHFPYPHPPPSETLDPLSHLISLHTTKPDESISFDGSRMVSVAKQGVGKMVPSRFVKGKMRREYEEYEAGYGSESSTEEVSG